MERAANRGELRRVLAMTLYYGIAKRLPSVGRPLGERSRRLREALARQFLDDVGSPVNLDANVHLGTGARVRIGEHSGIGEGSRILGGVTIGREVMLGPSVTVLSVNHRFDQAGVPIGRQGDGDRMPPEIRDGAWIGLGAIILPGRVIGEGAVVGAGSVVTRDVEPFTIVGGNPAKVIGRRAGAPDADATVPGTG